MPLTIFHVQFEVDASPFGHKNKKYMVEATVIAADDHTALRIATPAGFAGERMLQQKIYPLGDAKGHEMERAVMQTCHLV